MYLIFDTETTGLPRNFKAPPTQLDNWPRMVQLSWQLINPSGITIQSKDIIIAPDGFTIPKEAASIHGIDTQRALREGIRLQQALQQFDQALKQASVLIAHNIAFDTSVVHAEFLRSDLRVPFHDQERICTMKSTARLCGIRNAYGFKWPTLQELHQELFDCAFSGAHDAKVDVEACKKCFLELRARNML